MKSAQFARLDLNLIRVLDSVFRTGSVQAAAAQLALTPSAVSHSLSRLRLALDDKLFVRQRGKLQPTPYARRIAADVGNVLYELQVAIVGGRFLAAESSRHFTVIGSPYMSIVLMPEVIRRVRKLAPNVSISLLSSDNVIADDLDSGRCDIALGRFGHIPPRFEAQELFTESMVWVVRADHPLARRRVSLKALMATPQMVISVRGADEHQRLTEGGLERLLRRDDEPALKEIAAGKALSRTIALTVPDALTAMHYLPLTNLAALLPRRMVNRFAGTYDLHVIEPPYESPTTTMMILWHRQFGNQPDTKWFRSIVTDVAIQLNATTDETG